MNDTVPYGAEAIRDNQLLALPNPCSTGPYLIAWTFPEFTSLCPRSGYPDFATVHIWHVPDAHILELKSLKLYLNSYRDRREYHEAVTMHILDDITTAIAPIWAQIYMDFAPRGNLHTGITREYQPENRPSFSLPGTSASAWTANTCS